MRTDTPKTIYLKDYTPAPYGVDHVNLTFEIFDEKTIVTSEVQYRRTEGQTGPLILNGEEQKLISVQKDGGDFEDYTLDQNLLTISTADDTFTLTVKSEIDPAANTALEGLYKSGGNYCTQCEAEGFRRITYYQDRPDVMTTFTVRVEAGKSSCPILLSNGNLIEQGELDGDRHFTVWEDPTPKPCYLFALVAGDLVHVNDTFTTMSGQDVDLYIYVRKGDEDQCDHAMKALKDSMKWDEDVYGREYQYNIFNIVAVSDFNMGAMENTSLNIFNTALVLAHQNTATDMDFIRVESVIAHEYFHNWTGNRVTCRDWFQLSLKEGLTVFRDQEFSADMNSAPVQRIDDVTHLRRSQFPEDASPLAHPVRPESFITIDNFYTMTIYEKGAEVIRMFRTLMGAETYRKATDLYFDRHDGQAVTIDDWAQAMADTSGLDLQQFKLWYSQKGTPKVSASWDHDGSNMVLRLKQDIPHNGKDMHIPVAVGWLGEDGADLIDTTVLHLKESEQSFTFEGLNNKAVPSILRGFSAPVILETTHSDEELAFLMVNDSDGFNKWEAGQQFALKTINRMIDDKNYAPDAFLESFGALLATAGEPDTDRALMARALSLPDIAVIAQTRDIVDPDAIHKARDTLKRLIKRNFKAPMKKVYELCAGCEKFSVTAQSMGRRALRNTLLGYLTTTNGTGCAKLAEQHYRTTNTMTDKVAALNALLANKNAPREETLQEFYDEYKEHLLVIDKWFSLQAISTREDIFDVLAALKAHPDFTMKNPNRVRSLYGAFAMNNPVAFHSADGRGYDFLKEAIIELNDINPQIAARMVTPFREWRRYTADRQDKMKAALQEILDQPKLSPNVFELVNKTVNDE